MADVTVKLIIYRLGEVWSRAGERYNLLADWYADFSWRRVDILDMLFLGWLLAAFLVVGAINLYLRFFGLPRYGKGAATNGAVPQGSGGTPIRGGETCAWINSALSWIYLHYNSTPEFVDAWLKALNDEARKLSQGEFQVKFDRIQAGSLPPKLQQVSTDTSTKESLTIRANVESTDTTFLVSAIQQTATNIKVVPCDVNLQRLQGQLRVHASYESRQEEIKVELQFASPPDIKLQVKPRNYENNVDPSTVEQVVRSAICGAVTTLMLPARGGYPNFSTAGKQDFVTPTLRTRNPPSSYTPQRPNKSPTLVSHAPSSEPYQRPATLTARSSLTVYTTNTTHTTPSSGIERAVSVPGNISDSSVGRRAPSPATNPYTSRVKPATGSSAERDPPSVLMATVSSVPQNSSVYVSSRPSSIDRTISQPAAPVVVRPIVPHSLSMGSTPGAYPGSIPPHSSRVVTPDRPRLPPPPPPPPARPSNSGHKTSKKRRSHASAENLNHKPPANTSNVSSNLGYVSGNLGSMSSMLAPTTTASMIGSLSATSLANADTTTSTLPRFSSLNLITTKTVSSRPSDSSGPYSGTRSLAGRRLLVKVIKANGLGDRDFGSTDPYCIVTLDDPPQKHTTSVVKNTVNPFWDEHYLLELEDTSRQVKFEVYDREKPPGDDFLGRATIPMDELKRMPSSRQIIPLTGRPRAPTSTSGSITIEFLFMEGTEAQLAAGRLDESLSPRRRIETNRQVAPGGTVVTTTTTTTEKPRDTRLDSYYNETPGRIEKTELSDAPVNNHGNGRGSSQLGAHDAALTASQVSGTSNRPLGSSPQLTLTRPEINRAYNTMPMNEAAPGETDYQRDNQSLSTTASDQRAPAEVRMAELLRKKHERDMKKSKSFTSAIKRRFGRNKKPRSHSADRAQSSSFREGSLLKPPDHPDINQGARTAEDLDIADFPDGQLRKSRSRSFSSSLKRIFRKKNKGDVSRESSVSRVSGRGDVSREGSPYMSSHVRGGGTPQPPDDYSYEGEGYSMSAYGTSAPTRTSPLYDH